MSQAMYIFDRLRAGPTHLMYLARGSLQLLGAAQYLNLCCSLQPHSLSVTAHLCCRRRTYLTAWSRGRHT